MSDLKRPPLTISDRLRNMRSGSNELFNDSNPTTIRTIASRLASELGRTYETRWEDGGLRVWRMK